MNDSLEKILGQSATFFERLAANPAIAAELDKAAALSIGTIQNGGTILACGNGGSASQATHFTGELVGAFYDRDRRALPAIPLGFDTASLTSIANDFGFNEVFARQLQGLGHKNDTLWALSTSGNSPNILTAIETAREIGIKTVLFTNHDGGQGAKLADCVLRTPEGPTPRVQEAHLVYGHLLCQLIEAAMTGKA